MARRVGLLGGTFDPPHVGHVATAAEVRDVLGLHEVRLVVANDPWQKSAQRPVTPAGVRLELCRLAVQGVAGVSVSDSEIRRGGPSYTVDTVEELARTEPDVEPLLILGADAYGGIDTWHRARDLLGAVEVVVVDRDGAAPVAPGATVVRVPRLDVSSTDLRRRVAEGRTIDGLVPPAVVTRISELGLYRVGR